MHFKLAGKCIEFLSLFLPQQVLIPIRQIVSAFQNDVIFPKMTHMSIFSSSIYMVKVYKCKGSDLQGLCSCGFVAEDLWFVTTDRTELDLLCSSPGQLVFTVGR